MTDTLTKPDIEVLKSLLQQVEKAKGPGRSLGEMPLAILAALLKALIAQAEEGK